MERENSLEFALHLIWQQKYCLRIGRMTKRKQEKIETLEGIEFIIKHHLEEVKK